MNKGLLFILVGHFVKGVAVPTVVGVVGGKVLFQCSSDKNRPLKSFSFQGGPRFEVFLNGWHVDKKPSNPTRKETTMVNPAERTVSMWNLTVEDKGRYKCVVNYGDPGGETEDTIIYLNVSKITTAPPSPGKSQPDNSSGKAISSRNIITVIAIIGQSLLQSFFYYY